MLKSVQAADHAGDAIGHRRLKHGYDEPLL